ncbi:MAG: hypothetical protein JXR76_22445 [Deltaproteobacteria bacterium]|nr:hypothetical protein [Deltaproteobacteria bacterium]
MSTETIILEQYLPAITAIPIDKVHTPTMPMDTYLAEAGYLYHWAKEDLEELKKAGLLAKLLEELPYRRTAAAEAQAQWHNNMRKKEEAQARWQLESPEAFELRDELVHYMLFAFRNHEHLLNRVRSVNEGNSNADMIQDLLNLVVIGRENIELLTQVGFDPEKLEFAANVSQDMADLHGAATADKGSMDKSKLLRDQAYTHLKEAVDTIRQYGQFVFWKTPDRRKGYASEYLRKKPSKSNADLNPIIASAAGGTE